MSVNSAARRCATSRAPSSTTTAPMAARLTYSSLSTGAAALSPARNGDRIEGIWEAIDTVNGLTLPEIGRPTIPGTINVAPEETRLATLASSPLAWPAVSRPSGTVYPQVTSISSVPSLVSISGSAPGPMKSAPIRYGSAGGEPGVSEGLAAIGSAVQEAEAGWVG